jgi:hypothetical protein
MTGMFNSKKYVTSGVSDRVPIHVQRFIWSLVENLAAQDKVKIDYLQIFELKKLGNGGQQIIHKQKAPSYWAQYKFDKVEKPINVKLYAIDDGDHCTLLLPSER